MKIEKGNVVLISWKVKAEFCVYGLVWDGIWIINSLGFNNIKERRRCY